MKIGYTALGNTGPTHKVGLRLFGFVLASISVHIALLLSQHSSIEFGGRHNITIQVTLGSITTRETFTIRKQAEVTPLKKTLNTPVPLVRQDRTISTPVSMEQKLATTLPDKPIKPTQQQYSVTVEQQRQTATHTHTALMPAVATSESTGQQRTNIIQALKRAFNEQFYYPMLARKRGWQGTVLLAFSLDTRGIITNARIEQSSGYSVLDRAALKSLNQIARINEGPEHALSFERPIIYSLNEG